MQLDMLLIRHGITAGNQESRYIGQSDDQPLCERGIKELQRRHDRGEYPRCEAVFTSPMRRCIETARILYPMLVPVALPALTELDFGSFEGKTYEQLKENSAYHRWIDTGGEAAPPGGESASEFALRLCGALGQIAAQAESGGIRHCAVVTHGGCIMTLLSRFSVENITDLYQYQVSNGSGFRAVFDAESLRFTSIQPLLIS